MPALRWADLSDSDYGVALLNKSKHGYDIHKNVLRLTLLRSPASEEFKDWSVPDPLADRGKHTIGYSLVPHCGSWKEALIYRKAYEFNLGPYTRRGYAREQKGDEPPERSFLKVEPESVILTAFEQAENDSGSLILRLCEMWREKSSVNIELPFRVSRALKVNLIEEKEEEIEFDGGNKIKADIGACEILTLKIYF